MASANRKKQNGYKMPEKLPKGEVLQDMMKNQWRVGDSIGSGGFGLIYEARSAETTSKDYPYAIKFEPHSNGPLYVEMQFYMRNAKKDFVEKFKQDKKIKTLGMPIYIASGSHMYKDEKYRFVVMDKYGKDIWKIYEESEKVLPHQTVYKLAIQVLEVLQYIHERDYVHADIKGANLLVGASKGTQHQVYLVDFGLASHYNKDATFKVDPKKAHNGTIEYTSRDAHNGVMTRRGDIEILFYNLIHWFGGKLPWDTKLKDPKTVQVLKNSNMDKIDSFLEKAFSSGVPDGLAEIGQHINSLSHVDSPNYKKLHDIIIKGLKSCGGKLDNVLVFKPATKRKSVCSPGSGQPKKSRAKEATTKRNINNRAELNGYVSESPEITASNNSSGRLRKIAPQHSSKNTLVTDNTGDSEAEVSEITPMRRSPRNKAPLRTECHESDDDIKTMLKPRRAAKMKNDQEMDVVEEDNSVNQPKRRARRVNSNANGLEITSTTDKVTYTSEMLRMKALLDAKNGKSDSKMVPVPSTSKAHPRAGLKTKKAAEKIPPSRTRLIIETPQTESEDDLVSEVIKKGRKPRK